MAVFEPLQINFDGIDEKKLMKSLYRFAERLKFTLRDLDDDNFSEAMIRHRKEREDGLREINFDLDELKIRYKDYETDTETSLQQASDRIELLVSRGKSVEELMTRLEINKESITLRTGHVVFESGNFTVDRQGNSTISGNMVGGSIDIGGRFVVQSDGECYVDGGISVSLLNPSESVGAQELEAYNDNDFVNVIGGSMAIGIEAYISETLSCRAVRQTSDERRKEDVREITGKAAADMLRGLRPVAFRFRDSGRAAMGYIAQEVYREQERQRSELPMVWRDGKYLELPYECYGAMYARAIQDNQRRLDVLAEKARKRRKGG